MIVAAGAGMGMDSGLPAVRGAGGFADGYPELAAAGLRYELSTIDARLRLIDASSSSGSEGVD